MLLSQILYVDNNNATLNLNLSKKLLVANSYKLNNYDKTF